MGSGGLKATEMNLRLRVQIPRLASSRLLNPEVLHNGCLQLLRDGSTQRSNEIPKILRISVISSTGVWAHRR